MNEIGKTTIACFRDAAADEVLLAGAKNGDEQAFETLFKRHQQKVLRVVLRYVRIREDAEDIVQQSFQKAFVHLYKFEGKSSFSTWLTRIAINEALMFLRSIGAVRELAVGDCNNAEGSVGGVQIPDSSPDPETSYTRREGSELLFKALASLRPGMRTAVTLRDLCELSTNETARRMGLSVGAVKARTFHGRRKLRERLRRYVKPNRSGKKAPDMSRPSGHIPRGHLSTAAGL
jgi:RNA polymerase sigma-70 factor (ECF subfamily)